MLNCYTLFTLLYFSLVRISTSCIPTTHVLDDVVFGVLRLIVIHLYVPGD